MKKSIVMRAVAHEMDRLHNMYIHPANAGKPGLVKQLQQEANALHEAYFELRGHTGVVYNVHGMDTEAQRFLAKYDDIMRTEV